jgi:hypothetical protein
LASAVSSRVLRGWFSPAFLFHLLVALLPERLAAEGPGPPKFRQRCLIQLLQPPPLQVALRFLPPGASVLRDAMADAQATAQQHVGPQAQLAQLRSAQERDPGATLRAADEGGRSPGPSRRYPVPERF